MAKPTKREVRVEVVMYVLVEDKHDDPETFAEAMIETGLLEGDLGVSWVSTITATYTGYVE